MTRFIFRFGVFSGLFIFGLFVFSTFLKVGQENYDTSACYKLKIFLNDKSIDSEVIIFGSSVAEGALNPEIISNFSGKTTFNAALSGRRIIDWSCIALSFIDYTKNNKVIILDIFPNVFNETDQLYQPHEFYPYLDNRFVKNALSPISDTYDKMTRIPFYFLTQLNSKIIQNSFDGILSILLNYPSKINFDLKGYKNIKDSFEFGDSSILIKPKISPRSIALYEQLFLHAAAKDIDIVLVGMPVYFKGKEHYQNIDSVYQWGEVWNAKYRHVKFVNFVNDTTIISNTKFFANSTHLNESGASFISEKVANKLKNDIFNNDN